MISEAIQPGLRGEVRLKVAAEHTAQYLGSGSVKALATPQMALLMERASVAAVDRLLPDGYRTVGTHLDVRHLAPTPVGLEVKATAELTMVDGRGLTFLVQAHDEVELVGEGTHQRFIIYVQHFSERVTRKAG
jgi:predicted thioesterase